MLLLFSLCANNYNIWYCQTHPLEIKNCRLLVPNRPLEPIADALSASVCLYKDLERAAGQ